jgi:L-lactate permease
VEGCIESGTVPTVLGPELADLLAALITVVAVIGLLSFWRPSSEWHFERHLTPAPEFRPSG